MWACGAQDPSSILGEDTQRSLLWKFANSLVVPAQAGQAMDICPYSSMDRAQASEA
jgi:hypothetical protein